MQESGEMYLEDILILSGEKDHVRAVDVAEFSGYSKAAVSRALARLRTDGFIETDLSGYITFTPEGRRIAERTYEKHTVIASLLRKIGVDEWTASKDACKIEHVISDTTFEIMKKHMDRTR